MSLYNLNRTCHNLFDNKFDHTILKFNNFDCLFNHTRTPKNEVSIRIEPRNGPCIIMCEESILAHSPLSSHTGPLL